MPAETQKYGGKCRVWLSGVAFCSTGASAVARKWQIMAWHHLGPDVVDVEYVMNRSTVPRIGFRGPLG